MDEFLNSAPAEAIRSELETILASKTFRAARGQRKFLAYAVQAALDGTAHVLKEYVIATEALGREASFDPRLDPIVRIEARKLRARLAKYYETEGSGDLLRIEFRKGSYVPSFHELAQLAEEPMRAERAEPAPIAPNSEEPSVPPAFIHRFRFRSQTVFTFLAIVSLIAAGILVFRLSTGRFSQAILAANDASIAVLPLTNLSDNSEEFLSDGLTDEIINSLRQVPGLRVVGRTSAFRFKAKTLDMKAIDQKLHVGAVLVGTVSKSENRLRITVQLNDAANGYHLWSGNYERDSANLGAIAPEIASAVINVLGVGILRSSSRNSIQSAQFPNNEAHEDYLRGLYFRNRYTVDGLHRAIEYFKRAIAEDPSFARAYAGLADCYAMARPVAATPPLEVISKIKAAATKALELDATLGEPHIDLAVSAEYEFDWGTAEKEFKKGLELSPGDANGHLWYAWYLALVGRKADVLQQRSIAASLDPVSPYAVESVGGYYSVVGHYDAAIEQFRNALALEPDFGLALQGLGLTYLLEKTCGSAIEELRLANESMPGPRRLGHLGYAYAVCGRPSDARRILSGFLKDYRQDAIPAFAIAEIYLGLGEKDRAFPWFEKAIDERDLDMTLKWDPRFDSLRSDPRFSLLLRRMKLS